MFHKLILISTLLLFANVVAFACSCGEKPTVLDMFDGSVNVFTAKIVSIEDAPKAVQEEAYYLNGVKGAHAVVQKVYKGNVKSGDKVFFEQGGGADCIVTFKDEWQGKVSDEINKEFLVYNHHGGLQNIRLNYCGRLGDKEDFAYLDNIDKLSGKTRFSGWYKPWIFTESDALADTRGKAKVRVVGKDGKEYTATIDNDGFFELYDIPSGNYIVKPDMPKGFAVDQYSLRYTYLSAFAYFSRDPEIVNEMKKEGYDLFSSFPLEIKSGSHVRLDFNFSYYNPLSIKILKNNGRPFEGAGVAIHPVEKDGRVGLSSVGTSDKKGLLEISEFPPGKYYLVVNPKNEISAEEPFNTVYYPGVIEKEKAIAIEVPSGGLEKTFTIRLPKLYRTFILKGTLSYADGTPVAEDYVEFVPVMKEQGYDYRTRGKTDKFGRFEIRVLTDAVGYLKAEDSVYESNYKKCPELFQSLQAKFSDGKTYFYIKALSRQLTPKSHLSGIKLKYPFNPCQEK